MNLLSPLALLGLLGLGLPVLAHLLGRERPQRIRFAAVRFARPEEPVVTQRRSVRDWPLLLVRLLLLALLVLVLARPVVGSEAAVAVLAEPHDAVILVDASASMTLRVDGETELERARERVETLLDAMPPGSTVGLVVSDPRVPEVERAPVGDGAGRVRAALDAWFDSDDAGPRPGPWSLGEALPRATALLSDVAGGARPRVVYAVGDPTARGLGSLPEQIEGSITVIPIPTRGQPGKSPPAAPEHVGIREASWEPAPELDPRAVRVQAIVHRYGGDEGSLSLTAALDIGDREVAQTRVDVASDGDAAVEFTHTLGADELGAGAARARVRLVGRDGDPLTIDDRRHLWLAASDEVEVLVVNGDPSESRVEDEIFFLSMALANSELGDRVAIRGLAKDQLEDRLRARKPGEDPLASVDLLILANVRALSPELAPAIGERVRAGMGLWITVGDRVSAAEYNARYGDLLPLLLREAVYAGTAVGRAEARGEAVAPAQLSHPMFAGFDREQAGGDLDFGSARCKRMFLLEPDARRGADIALAFSSGAPALLTRRVGRGRVALLTTTVDRDWGDLPLRPGFVPLVTQTVEWLVGAQRGGRGSTVPVGGAKSLARAEPYTVTTPGGGTVPVTPARDGAAVFDATDRPGHYVATPTVAASQASATKVERFVVELDPREADTAAVGVARAQVDSEAGTVTIFEPRWRELAMLGLLFLALESAMRWWAGRRRNALS